MRQFCDPIFGFEFYQFYVPAFTPEELEADAGHEKWYRLCHNIRRIPISPVRLVLAHSSGGKPG